MAMSTEEINMEAIDIMDGVDAVEKHIKEYLVGIDECIDEIISGHHVIANHHIVEFRSYPIGVCKKCGAKFDGVILGD